MKNINSWQRHSTIASWIRVGALAVIALSPALAQFTFTTFDVPGANGMPATAIKNSTGTHPAAINNNGDIAGTYDNASGGVSGFIRKADGTFTLFDLSSVNVTLVQVTGINDLGEVAGIGNLNNAAGLLGWVGFVRNSQGNISTISASPGMGIVFVAGLNNAGESVVQFGNMSGYQYFLRTAADTYTSLPSPGGELGFVPYKGLNNNGEAVGNWGVSDPGSGLSDGFVQDLSSQQFTRFDFATGPSGAFTKPGHGTMAVAINDSGVVFGCYITGANLTIQVPFSLSFQCVDYLRGADGSLLESFVPPFPEPGHFTNNARGLNNAGLIVGEYSDANGAHAYVGTPSASAAHPDISLVQVIPGPPEQAVFSVVDPVAGLFHVATIWTNCSAVTVAPFEPGQTTPVMVTATKAQPALKAVVGIEASNGVGNITDFDPTFVTVYGTGGPPTEPLPDVALSEHVLTIANGDPGLEKLGVGVNEKKIVVPLKPNEKRTLNLQTWMTLASNSVTFSGEGSPNGYASVVLRDGAAARTPRSNGNRAGLGGSQE